MEAVKFVIASIFFAKTQYCTDFSHDLKFLPGKVSHKMAVTGVINIRLMDKEFKS